MAKFFAIGNVYQGTTQACLPDTTPPTFAGIATLTALAGGQLRATWLAASDVTLPIRYEVYTQELTDVGLFDVANIVGITSQLSFDILSLANGTYLTAAKIYYVGVRALDGVSNRDTNLVSMDEESLGVSIGGVGAVLDQLSIVKQWLQTIFVSLD